MKTFILIIVYFALMVLFIQDSQCQVSQEWYAQYIGPYNIDFPSSMVADLAGNIYVTGSSRRTANISDYATVKFNTTGVQQWVARYNWPNGTNLVAIASSVTVDKSENVYVTGISPINSTNNPIKTTTVKYNSTGVQQWTAIFYGYTNNLGDDGIQSVAVDDSGYVYVTTSSYWPVYGNYLYTTIKYNSSGVQQWCAAYVSYGDSRPCRIAIDNSSNVYVTGYSRGDTTHNDIATVKYNSAGKQQWATRYNGPGNRGDSATDLKVDSNGNVYVCGASVGTGTYYDYVTIKYNSSGVQQWAARYNGTAGNSNAIARSIGVDNSGNVYVTGYSINYPDSIYCTTIKYNSSGIQQWVVNYDYEGFGSMGEALALDKYGYIYVSASSSEGIRDHIATIKYSPEGVKQWSIVSNVNPYGEDPIAIALDSSDNVYIAGGDGHYLTIKYDQLLEIKPVSKSIPNEFKLYQNYPNPFNPSTKIKFEIPSSNSPFYERGVGGFVTIKIYDILGKEVSNPLNEKLQPGTYEIEWDGNNFVSGIYFYKIEIMDPETSSRFVYKETKRMVLLK